MYVVFFPPLSYELFGFDENNEKKSSCSCITFRMLRIDEIDWFVIYLSIKSDDRFFSMYDDR